MCRRTKEPSDIRVEDSCLGPTTGSSVTFFVLSTLLIATTLNFQLEITKKCFFTVV